MNSGKLAIFVAVLIFMSGLYPAGASATKEHMGRQYVENSGRWYQLDQGRRWEVNSTVITVKFKTGADALGKQQLQADLGTAIKRQASTGFVDIELGPEQDVFELIQAYLDSGLVEIAEPNTFGEYSLSPDDPSYGSQYFLPQISAENAWDVTTGSANVVVAVLDSGTEFSHDDLGFGTDAFQNVWLNNGEDAWTDPDDPTTGNGIDDDMNGYVDDWKGYDFSSGNNDGSGPFFHGTAVAGMVAAKSHNGLGIASIAGGWNGPGAQIMIAGVGDNAPDGSSLDDAILYAAEMGASIVQLSLTTSQTAAIDAALATAYNTYGVTIICSSGNGSTSTVGYPSIDSHVIAVGATDESDQRAGFSQHGPDLEVSAPGVNVLTTTVGNGYTTTGGTSFAAPLTSGVAALMLAANPGLTNAQIRQTLKDTADKVGGYNYDWNVGMPGHSQELGYGRVNAERAVAAVQGLLFDDGFESGGTLAWWATVP